MPIDVPIKKRNLKKADVVYKRYLVSSNRHE